MAVVIMTLAAAACTKEPDAKSPVITLAAEEVNLDAEGTTEQIAYSVSSPVEGEEIAVSEDAEWLTVSTEKARIIEFSANRNDSGDVRSAEVVVSYPGAKSVNVTVRQDVWEAPITITVNEVDATTATFSVAVKDPELTWVVQCVGKEWWDTYESEEKVFKEDLDYFQWMANDNDMSLQEYLSTVLHKGSKENLKFNGLDPISEYVIYVYGLDTEGEHTTSIYSEPITTEEPYDGPITFEIDVTEENHIMDITIKPSHEGVAYYWNIMDEATFNEWGSDVATVAQDFIDYDVEDYLYYGDISDPSEYFEWFSSNGTENTQFESLAGTKYLIYASKWGEDCKLSGDVEYVWFQTEAVEPSTNVITLNVSNPTQSSFEVTTTTTNDDPYVVLAEPSEWCGWADMTDKEIYDYVMAYYGTWFITDYICTGNLTDARFYDLDPDTEYTVIAFGYEAGAMTTAVQKTTVKTLAAGDPKDCTFDFNVIETTSTSAYVSVEPSDGSHYYYWFIYESDATAEDVKADIQATIDDWYYGDFDEFAYYELVRGNNEGEVSYLSPSTEYRIAAVIMDDNTGEFLSDVAFSEPFMTKEMKYADISITATFDKYYDGDALSAAVEDTYDQYAGYAMLPVSINIDGDYEDMYCAIFVYEEGLDDPEVYSDADLYGSIIENGYVYGTEIRYRAPWDTPLMITAMATDYDGNYSPVYRHKFTLTKSGASPIEDIIGSANGAAAFNAASFGMPERKAEIKRVELKKDLRFSTEVIQAKREECKVRNEALKREAAQDRLAIRKSSRVISKRRWFAE